MQYNYQTIGQFPFFVRDNYFSLLFFDFFNSTAEVTGSVVAGADTVGIGVAAGFAAGFDLPGCA